MSISTAESNWRIVAVWGKSAYLVHTSGELHTIKSKARVLDLNQGILFPEFALDSILARGYWDEYAGPQDVLPGLLAQVRRVDKTEELQFLPPLE